MYDLEQKSVIVDLILKFEECGLPERNLVLFYLILLPSLLNRQCWSIFRQLISTYCPTTSFYLALEG